MKYDLLREEEKKAAKVLEREIFRATIIARTKGEEMDEEEQFIYELIFKPREPGFRLRPEHVQLLLSYFEELLKQIERN